MSLIFLWVYSLPWNLHKIVKINWKCLSWSNQKQLVLRAGIFPLLQAAALLAVFEVMWCCLCLSCFAMPDQAADDHVKIKITKYKTGSSPDGQVKVQEMGEGDPQWQHIKDVVKEQLEKAGLKAEGMSPDPHGHISKHASLPLSPHLTLIFTISSSSHTGASNIGRESALNLFFFFQSCLLKSLVCI